VDLAHAHVVLIGAMGSGKSTIGRPLAERLERRFVDNDTVLRQRTGRTPAELAEQDGVDALHAEEAATLRSALQIRPPAVIAAAASVVDDPGVRVLLLPHRVVWLWTDPDDAARRNGEKDHRPDLGGNAVKRERDRHPRYQAVADFVLDPEPRDPDVAVDLITKWLHNGSEPTSR
jgi:shikimate kinase